MKFCSNCGCQLGEESAPPVNPGNQLQMASDLTDDMGGGSMENSYNPVNPPVNPPAPYIKPNQYTNTPPVDVEVVYDNGPINRGTPSQDETVPEYIKPKKNIAKIIIPVAGVVALAGIGVFAVPKILDALGSGSMPVAYVSGKEYMLAPKINGKKTKTMDVIKTKYEDRYANDSYAPSLLQFGEDGKYMFFITKFDTYEGTGTLNYVECSKVKGSAEKNEKNIKNIDSDVGMFSVISNSSVVYLTGDQDLYFFDGKDTQQIHKDVANYWADQKGNIIYSVYDESDGTAVYYAVTTKDISDSKKLLSDVDGIYLLDSKNLDKILLVKNDEDNYETFTLYECGYSMKDSNKLASNVSTCQVYNHKAYFTTITDKKSSYDLIEDSYADKDKGITEPDSDDYQVPYYYYSGISDTTKSYSEMYTSITNRCYWFDKGWGYSSMEYSVDNSSYSDGVRAAVQAFIDKYEDKEDSQGYLLVTSEVMKDLQAINDADSSKKTNDWVKLCFTREESGTTTDWDAYEEAWEKYDEASGRIYTRESLQSSDYDLPVYSLMQYSDGLLNTISENISSVNWSTDCIQYNTFDMINETIPIEEYQGSSQLRALTDLNYTTQPIFIHNTFNGETVQFDSKTCESIEDISSDGYGFLLATTDHVYYEYDEEIYSAPIEKNIVGSFDEISDDIGYMTVSENKLYYSAEPYSSHNVYYGDLHCISDGKDELIAKDISIENIAIYDDGMIAYSKDGYMGSNGFTLTVKKEKGDEIEVGDDVSRFVRINDNHIYYLADDDLYDFNGKESERVISSVDYFWVPESMNADHIYLY